MYINGDVFCQFVYNSWRHIFCPSTKLNQTTQINLLQILLIAGERDQSWWIYHYVTMYGLLVMRTVAPTRLCTACCWRHQSSCTLVILLYSWYANRWSDIVSCVYSFDNVATHRLAKLPHRTAPHSTAPHTTTTHRTVSGAEMLDSLNW